ncbi:hypothetical protein [uncultured Anaerotruncus sp.]|uniref:hypothetical protein n=1 Tax=uncultured Anaerotruncus sp. TaxID=905011 RepID=UPI002670EC51|nr:hypothetical protein [uncultured Anaerotruncus sp.]
MRATLFFIPVPPIQSDLNSVYLPPAGDARWKKDPEVTAERFAGRKEAFPCRRVRAGFGGRAEGGGLRDGPQKGGRGVFWGRKAQKLPFFSHKTKKTPIDSIKNNSAKYLKCSVKSIFPEDRLHNLRLVTEKVA